jgi:hypothetical protein
MVIGRGGYPLGEIPAYLAMGDSFSIATASLAARGRRAGRYRLPRSEATSTATSKLSSSPLRRSPAEAAFDARAS